MGEPSHRSRRLSDPLMKITPVFLGLRKEVGRREKEVVHLGKKAEIA